MNYEFKKIPLRQCVGCREMKPKALLIRVVKSPDGEDVSVDYSGKKPGRGAYVCNDAECLKRVEKSRALSRAFRRQIPDSIMEELHGSSNQRKTQ